MKHITLPFILLLLAPLALFGGNADYFILEDETIDQVFDQVSAVESALWQDLAMGKELVIGEHLGTTALALGEFGTSMLLTEPPLGVPSFWWGFCFGFTGIAVVYFFTNSKDEALKALKGWAISTVSVIGCTGLSYIAYVIFIFNI